MSATATPAPTAAPPSSAAPCDCAERAALMTLMVSASLWFAASVGLSLLASLKLHAPQLLAECPFFTYGRVVEAAGATFLYGFAVQAALAVGLWTLCRLGHTVIAWPRATLCGWFFWNSAMGVGALVILCGGGGRGSAQMPYVVGPVLFLSFLVMAVSAALTFHSRQEGALYPTQWFVLGSLFWFAWTYSTSLALHAAPVRGVAQSVADAWCANNLRGVFLDFAGLGAIFYFLPKLLGRPLYSGGLAALAFWILALFGSWRGVEPGGPLPVWIGTMSTVGAVFTSAALIAVALNVCHTASGSGRRLDSEPTLRFCYVAVIFWLIAGAQQIVQSLPHVSALAGLTWFGAAQTLLQYRGFFAFAMFGSFYYIAPRLLNAAWCPRLLAAHFWLLLLGVVASYLPMVVGGIGEGIILSDPGNSFNDALRASLVAVRAGALGDLLVFVASLVFLANLAGLFKADLLRGRDLAMSLIKPEGKP